MISRLPTAAVKALTRHVGLAALTLTFVLGTPTSILARGERMYSTSGVGSAVLAWQRQHYRDAIGLAREALREPITRREKMIALHLLCVVQADHLNARRALRYCDRAVKIEGDRHWKHLNNRAYVRMKLRDWEGAVEDYRHALAAYDALSESQRSAMNQADGRHAMRETVEKNLQLATARLGDQAVPIASNETPTMPAPASQDEGPQAGQAPPPPAAMAP